MIAANGTAILSGSASKSSVRNLHWLGCDCANMGPSMAAPGREHKAPVANSLALKRPRTPPTAAAASRGTRPWGCLCDGT